MRLFQNFSFWKSYLRFYGKTGLLDSFSKAISKNCVPSVRPSLEMARMPEYNKD
jgi:hypothetical protein